MTLFLSLLCLCFFLLQCFFGILCELFLLSNGNTSPPVGQLGEHYSKRKDLGRTWVQTLAEIVALRAHLQILRLRILRWT